MHVSTSTEWQTFQRAVTKWFHRPNIMALRACLATVKALDLDTTPVWLMLIGPSSCGKSELYLQSCKSYSHVQETSDFNLPALISLDLANSGEGILKRLGSKGLWLINDFSSVLSGKEETRYQVTSACREIFDGEYRRAGRGRSEVWKGHVNVIAACTPAIESYYKVHADLGERFLQIQLDRVSACRELRQRTNMQRRNVGSYHREIKEASSQLLSHTVAGVMLNDKEEDTISLWAEFVATCRTTVKRSTFNDEIMELGYTEGSSRLYQELLGVALGDAAILGQPDVGRDQIELVEQLALDCLSRGRRAVLAGLLQWPLRTGIRRSDLQDMSGIKHNQAFTRVLDDLAALEIIQYHITTTTETQTLIEWTPHLAKLLTPLVSPKV